jgi:hypothetical protein
LTDTSMLFGGGGPGKDPSPAPFRGRYFMSERVRKAS